MFCRSGYDVIKQKKDFFTNSANSFINSVDLDLYILMGIDLGTLKI